MTETATPDAELTTTVHRVEVRPALGHIDSLGRQTHARASGHFDNVTRVATATVYLIEAALDDAQVQQIATQLLADPVDQHATIGSASVDEGVQVIEVGHLPGVMDPTAQSTESAIRDMLGDTCPADLSVQTAKRYDLHFDGGDTIDDAALRRFASRYLANPVINQITLNPHTPEAFAHGSSYSPSVTHVPIRELDDEALTAMSRQAHLFLSLTEMQGVQAYFRQQEREPTEIELETIAQTWSEHCVHKTLKSKVRYEVANGDKQDLARFEGRPGCTIEPDGSVTIDNLLKSTVAAATRKLMQQQRYGDWCVSVFEDNSGIVRFDDEHGVCIKVETHNHPSAIEPYGGAATGIGGCIRDIIGTGLAAWPIANTDVFAVADPNTDAESLPAGVLHPRRILEQVVAGVRDYGNRMGIPTINGAVWFDDDFLGNPLVFAGCVGLIPLDRCFGEAKPGDRIIALGGATGRDGIHGATFSSAELTDTHADEFSHAVQIGNPITEKQMLDVIMQARGGVGDDGAPGPHGSECLFSAITDCGAGGFSSAIGEMGEKVGAVVQLERAPLKYPGLTATEIWISEAQERMVLSVPPKHVDALRQLCEAENVPMCDLGHFGEASDAGDPTLVLRYDELEVGRLSMTLLHDGIPQPTRQATGRSTPATIPPNATHEGAESASVEQCLLKLLSHGNIASKHWIVRQYDHEVQGGSVVKPLVGPLQIGPSDAAVVRPKLGSQKGIALGNGLAPDLSEKATERGWATDGDSYAATLCALDEAARNVVCVGGDPQQICVLDNFCWPGCDDPANLGSLVRAACACYDAAMAYHTPFVSGKDSLNNQFTTEDGRRITIPPTLLITAMAIVPDVSRCVTMDAKSPDDVLFVVGDTDGRLGGSHLVQLGLAGAGVDLAVPMVDLEAGPRQAAAVAGLIEAGLVRATHDCSEGGLLVAAAEMAFAGSVGLDLDLSKLPGADELTTATKCFAQTPSRYLLAASSDDADAVADRLADAGVNFGRIGTFAKHDRLTLADGDADTLDMPLATLVEAWRSPLDW